MSAESLPPFPGHEFGSPENPMLQSAPSAHGHETSADTPDPIESIVQGVNPASLDEEGLESLVDRHPLARELAERLRRMRASKLSHEEEQAYVDNVRAMRQEIGDRIKEKLGLAVEDEETVARRAEAERLRALGNVLSTITGHESEDELLVKYGLIGENAGMNSESIDSPLFRGDTKRAFNRYTRFAVQFDAMERAEELTGTALRNTPQASNMRWEAHNTVAHLVERDLGLPFDAARRFVAKMREAKVPGTHEKADYAALLRGEKLAEKFGHDAAAFTRESLGDLIKRPMDHENSAH